MNAKPVIPLACAAALALCAGCTSPSTSTSPAASGTAYSVPTLKLEGGTDWGAPNPFLCQPRGPGTAKMKLVYASLLEKDEKGDVPWLAESWNVNGNDYTFTLFEDAVFQDGEALTSDDVAFTLDYYKEHPPVSNPLGVGEEFMVDHYTVVDDHTITLTVTEPDADTLSSLGSFVILPQHIWSEVDDPYSYTGEGYLVGSGAFCCTQYDGATGLYEFTAYEGWCNGKQGTEKIQFIPVSDPLLAFDAGELDITSLPADLKDAYLSDPNIGLVDKANDMGYKLLINYEKCPEFLQLSCRQAVYAAIDRQSVVDNVFRGAGTVGSAGYVPQGSIYYNENVVKYEYNPQQAQAVLGNQGLSVTLLCGSDADDLAIAEIIRNGLTQAGMTVSVASYDSATRDEKINQGSYEFALVGNGGWGNNPPTYMRTLFSDISKFSGTNPHSMGAIGYSNEEMTRLAEGQQAETDFDQRVEMFQELELLVSQEIPILVIANQSTYSMYRKDYYDGWMKTYAYQQAEQNRLSYMER
ncbi:peptide ABC transporter substrate-binding protein [Pseudoflavonifractor capillosus]|uniref:ABC transporter substrate-binding protein n=1 Tax=Pseudoflavonifractor capillosus TaxID=106588 RepID=UPI0019596486|nr:ABC transporter substrate-binding protein [Pseudoflavonifractor capillosus]MBM6896314.1 peptide ABC transporter substrate-binding protein [Pseudoflavonifractor capillosus]